MGVVHGSAYVFYPDGNISETHVINNGVHISHVLTNHPYGFIPDFDEYIEPCAFISN